MAPKNLSDPILPEDASAPVVSAPALEQPAPSTNDEENEELSLGERFDRLEALVLGIVRGTSGTTVGVPATVTAPPIPADQAAEGPVPGVLPDAPVSVQVPEQHPSESLPAPVVPVEEGLQHPTEGPAQTLVDVSADVITTGSGEITAPVTPAESVADEEAEIADENAEAKPV